jgi:serine/threonine kinase PknH
VWLGVVLVEDPTENDTQLGSRAGSPFGHYRLRRLLGRGGFGEVYEAEDTVMDRMVAVKLLAPAYSQNKAFRERLYREARAAGRLHDPHVVPIHQCGEIDGQLYIDMRLIKGTDLQAVLARRGALTPALAVAIVRQIASALDAAHADQMVHRDVKPGNILLTDDDFACLVDFGLANAATDAKLTSSGTTIGTFAYMAPERLSNAEVSHRADIYALACVLYECLTGSPPYPTGDLPALITAHLTAPIPRPSQHRSQVTPGFDNVIRRGMAKSPDERYASAGQLAAAAQHVLTTSDQDHVETILASTEAAHRPDHVQPTSTAQASASSSPTKPRSHQAKQSVAADQRHRPETQRKLEATPVRKRRTSWIVAAVVAIPLLVGGSVIAWHPWERQALSSSTGSPQPLTSTEPSTPPALGPTATKPPPPTLFSAKAIDQVLLTADHLSKVLTANFSDNPSVGGRGGLGLNSSSYGMSDHSQQVTPPSCVGVVFTGEHDVYASADPTAIKTQTFGAPYGVNAGTPHLLQQTGAVLPSVEDAQQFLTSSEGKWKACGSLKVSATFGYESGAGYILGGVVSQGDLITVGMASTNNLGPTNGADACEQAMGVRKNVVVEVRTCEAPDLTSAPASPDLVWVVPDAEKVAKAMLDNVVP